jgi:hypothetical protein
MKKDLTVADIVCSLTGCTQQAAAEINRLIEDFQSGVRDASKNEDVDCFSVRFAYCWSLKIPSY